ncbi:tol-pal system protein YbgF [Pelagibacterium sediminicola]|uniref:tol-pal system protein YbgF n=1 Tax=Pelagibacterium sediminicola TaxID=2248761 RepID=UPI0013008A45|nr:tol-pal system protein YbgF [Pelagibacterium sediminicola]
MTNLVSRLATRGRQVLAVAGVAGLLTVAMTVSGQGQGNDLAAMQVRLDQLDEQVRVYSGQIEGLQFQMTQLQTLIERMQEDNEFRFQQLEGGASGESDAVTPSGGAMPAERLPQDPQLPDDLSNVPVEIDGSVLMGDEDLYGDTPPDGEGLFASEVFGEDGVVLGPPEGELGSTPPSQPLNLDFDPNAVPLNDGDANAQYQAGYDAIVRGEYAFAEDQFSQFVALFPDHPQAPDATYWLGDAMIQRGAYDEAAAMLLTGFESYPTSSRAPDILLKLGVALHGTGEFDTACRTYSEVLRRYPDSTQAFKDRVAAEQARAGC